MSGFKRMQSKVFWGQMAAQDLDHSPLIPGAGINSAAAASGPVAGGNFSHAYCNLAMHSEESEESLRESDGSDGNVTAIRVNEVVGERALQEEARERKRTRPEVAGRSSENSRTQDTVDGIAVGNRSKAISDDKSSPNACNRSLDSGFSDSDRSNSPDIYDDETPRRRRRRRVLTRGRPQLSQRVHHRLSSLWRDSERPPNPAHTSTPKAERHPASRRVSRCVQPKEIRWKRRESHSPEPQRVEEDQENNSAVVASPPIEEECLGEFLYATEPPEDEDVHAISNVSPIASLSDCSARTRRRESLEKSVAEPRNRDQHTAVKAWLADLVMETEGECCITLQSKALPRRKFRETMSEESQSRDLRLLTSSATAAATELLVRADGFTRHLRQVVDKVSHLESGRSERELLRSVEDEAFSILSELGAPPPRRIHQSNLRGILAQLENIGNSVDNAIDTRLDFYIERVVRGLEEAPSEGGSAARGALAALTALGLAGTRAGSSIARCLGVRALLTSLISAGRLSSDLRASTLRALASVCCCPVAIEQFVREDGPEILIDLLAAETTPETEKMEATALVVQITAPWTNALGLIHLEPFAKDLVDFLTKLAERTTCGQTLLLAAAALNNLADSRKFVPPILAQEAVRKLLKCVKKSAGGNVWLMEQVASLVGKLAKIPEARPHLARARASVALVCFLRMGPPGLEDAYRRLEITAAEALTRLCVDPEIARQVVAVGGADCLPSYSNENHASEDEEQAGLLKYTKSLRRACKRAAREIDVAKACDYSITTAALKYLENARKFVPLVLAEEAVQKLALVCFLKMAYSGLEDAYRKLEMTAAEAFTKLCVYQEIARENFAVRGADFLPL